MQELIILLLFLAAAGYLGWRAYQSMARKKAGCGKGCGCEADKTTTKTVGARY